MVRNRRNVALLFAVYFLQGLCFYSPVATLYRLEAGLTLFQTGLLESISLAAMLLLEIPWGRAADRIGHRRTLVICSALFALSKVVFWKARAFPDFLAERLILAVALAGLSGCDSAYLFACVGEKESQRIFGLWNAVQTAGLLVAGMSASLFLSEHYRRGALWTVLSYSAAALLTLLLTDPEEDGEKPAATAPRPGMAAAPPEPLHGPLPGGERSAGGDRAVHHRLSQPAPLSARRAPRPDVRLALRAGDALRAGRGPLPPAHQASGPPPGRRAPLPLRRRGVPDGAVPRPPAGGGGGPGAQGRGGPILSTGPFSSERRCRAGARAAQLSCNAMVMDVVSLVLNPAFGRAADAGCGQALLLGATACGGGLLLFWAGAKPAASPA